MFAMGYNGREFRESSFKMGATSNGVGSDEGLAMSMSNLSVDQSTSGSNNNNDNSTSNNQSPLLSQSQSFLSRSTSASSLRTNLNPHAAEFVPSAFKAPATSQAWEQQKSPTNEAVGSRLDRTNSSNSNASDDEYRKFCRSQLPDDLMPDFGDFLDSTITEYEKPVAEVPGRATNWAGESAVRGDNLLYDERAGQNTTVRATPYSPRFGVAAAEGSTSTGFVRPYMPELRGSPVNKQQQRPGWTESSNDTATAFTEWGSSDLAFPEDLTEVIDPVTVLATEFPGFASESLADIYYANGGDLALTMDMLTELELQNEGASVRQFQQPPTPAPPSSRDFPALAGLENITRSQLSGRAALGETRSSVPDFAAAVRKQAAQQAAQIQFERNGGVDLSLRGLSQAPGVGGFARETRVAHNERLDPFHLQGHEGQAPTAWLETGDSVANMYADMREEARDYARVRNAYFDQARQAYLSGNKALAKELSAKGQWHNEQMKAAHSKAGEAIFWRRNSNAFVNNSSSNNVPGQPHLIDLHGLHVGEAIPLLKREIAQLRYSVRSTRQRANVLICVGTGHHTKGSRTPSRLPAAVQRYLLEEEHLQFTEPQAGMLRIIIR